MQLGVPVVLLQRTLKNAIEATGIGLHTGKKVYMTLRPAPVNTGIVFRRVDMAHLVDIKADARSVQGTELATTLCQGDASVSTIEHLMSAFAGLGVDNCYVDLSAEEVPIMDGSAGPFVYLLQSAGLVEQGAAKRFIRVTKPVVVKDGDRWARLDPFNGFKVDVTIDFQHPVLANTCQRAVMDFSSASFVRDVSRARTFGFMKDLEYMQSRNLALGGSTDNAIVLDDYRVLNENGLRYSDEFVKHKVLDALGDLFLLGHSLVASFSGYKPGHAMNNLLARQLLATPSAYEIATFDIAEEAPVSYAQPVEAFA